MSHNFLGKPCEYIVVITLESFNSQVGELLDAYHLVDLHVAVVKMPIIHGTTIDISTTFHHKKSSMPFFCLLSFLN